MVVEASVDRDGLVTSCRIKQPFGHVALDEQTCALFRARARFEPAKDRRGRPVASSYQGMLVWRLEGQAHPLLPRQAWRVQVTMATDGDERIVDCDADATGLSSAAAFCPADDAAGDKRASAAVGSAMSYQIVEIHFFPVEAAKAVVPPNRTDGNKIAQQVSEVVIDAEGRVSECTAMRYSGRARPETDHCKAAYEMQFDAGGAAPLTGTVVITAYVRQHSNT